ncbi:MAG: DUF6703 family protein [Streptosporangiaceae bacterium]
MSANRPRQAGDGPRPAGQARPGRRRGPRPLPRGRSLQTPDATPARASVEQRSATTLLWLHQLPAWVPPVLAVALLVAGLAMRGWAGGIALFGLAVVLAWLAAISWPRLSGPGRLLRIVVAGLVIAAGVIRGLHG